MGVVVNDFNPSTRWGEGYLCSLASLVYIANSRLVRANEAPDRVAEEKWKQGSKERREGRIRAGEKMQS